MKHIEALFLSILAVLFLCSCDTESNAAAPEPDSADAAPIMLVASEEFNLAKIPANTPFSFSYFPVEVSVLFHSEPTTDYTFELSNPAIGSCEQTEDGKLLLTPSYEILPDAQRVESELVITCGKEKASFLWYMYKEETQIGDLSFRRDTLEAYENGVKGRKQDKAFTAASNYDPVIDFYHLTEIIGMPQYNVDEIRKMIDDHLTLDEVAEKISTLPDLVQYMHQKQFSSDGSGDLHLPFNGFDWSVNRTAQTIFNSNAGNCGGMSHLANYILSGDFDEQGYVGQNDNRGGHIFNWFRNDGIYYFCDFTQIVWAGNYNNEKYSVYKTTDPEKFAHSFIVANHRNHNDYDPSFTVLLFMYPWEGDSLPKGNGKHYTAVLPKDYESITTVLYASEKVYWEEDECFCYGQAYTFDVSPGKELYPREAL